MTIEVSGDVERLIEAAIATRKFNSAEEFITRMAAIWQEREFLVSATASLKDSATAFDALSRLGVIGCMQPGATDLATNASHMEGFGK